MTSTASPSSDVEEKEEDEDDVSHHLHHHPLEDPPRSAPPNNNCPKQHGLYEFATSNDSFTCDACGEPQLRESTMFGCRLCNYDLCTRTECSGDLCLASSQEAIAGEDVEEEEEASSPLPPASSSPVLLARPHRHGHPHRRCRNMHGMVAMRWDEVKLCDECGQDQPRHRQVLSCALCQYDLCRRCAKLPVETWYEVLRCTPQATQEELFLQAWRLSVQYRRECVHNPSVTRAAHLDAVARFEQVGQALVVLTEHRAEYDHVLAAGGGPADYVPPAAQGRGASARSDRELRERLIWCVFHPVEAAATTSTSSPPPPSIAHGVCVATVGALAAPVLFTVYIGGKLTVDVAHGALVLVKSCARGAALVASGASDVIKDAAHVPPQRRRRQEAGSTSHKVHSVDHSAQRARSRRVRHAKAPKWRRIALGVREPVRAVVAVTLLVAVSTAVSAGAVVCGGAYGIAANVHRGVSEVRQAVKKRNTE